MVIRGGTPRCRVVVDKKGTLWWRLWRIKFGEDDVDLWLKPRMKAKLLRRLRNTCITKKEMVAGE